LKHCATAANDKLLTLEGAIGAANPRARRRREPRDPFYRELEKSTRTPASSPLAHWAQLAHVRRSPRTAAIDTRDTIPALLERGTNPRRMRSRDNTANSPEPCSRQIDVAPLQKRSWIIIAAVTEATIQRYGQPFNAAPRPAPKRVRRRRNRRRLPERRPTRHQPNDDQHEAAMGQPRKTIFGAHHHSTVPRLFDCEGRTRENRHTPVGGRERIDTRAIDAWASTITSTCAASSFNAAASIASCFVASPLIRASTLLRRAAP